VALIFSGLAWAIATGVAVPDQDPTAAMQERAQFHGRIVEILFVAGAISFLAAVVVMTVSIIQGFAVRRRER
jgi:hypothetical protein